MREKLLKLWRWVRRGREEEEEEWEEDGFCRARPGLPGEAPEHIHQFPYTEADAARYREFGYMVSVYCVLPGVPAAVVEGDPEPKPFEILDRTGGNHA